MKIIMRQTDPNVLEVESAWLKSRNEVAKHIQYLQILSDMLWPPAEIQVQAPKKGEEREPS